MKHLKFAATAALLPLVLCLNGCDQVQAMLKPKPEKPGPYAFDFVIRMSPKSEAVMKKTPGIFVDAWYFGDAAPAYRAKADQLNRIELGDERWNFSNTTRRVHIEGQPIDTSKLSQTSDGVARVFLTADINSNDPGYVLTCHSFIGPIRQAQEHPQTLDCQFDAERYWEDVEASEAASSQ